MPRPTIDISHLRQELTILYEDNLTYQAIIQSLSRNYSIELGRTTLYRIFKEWGLSRQVRTEISPQLLDRIKHMFFKDCLKDKLILRRLQDEGHIISMGGLRRIRKENGMFRRQDPDQLQIAKDRARSFFEEQSQVSTAIQHYGRGYLYTYMRQQHHIISRDALYSTYREFAPESVTERWGKARYHRRDFKVAGPDWVWSIDGYDKLKQWGFEIYAGIDAYARYITWFYCGFSASTSWNVAVQYLHVLTERGMMPKALRSDHGGETSLICGIHFYLSGNRKKKVGSQLVPIEFRDCWYFGRSVHNTRIESWWHRLYQARGGFWRKYFQWLTEHGLFDGGSIADRAAILYIYMNPIRHDLISFVHMWNSHTIRRQPGRPHVKEGQPTVLYHDLDSTEARNFAEEIPPDRLQTGLELFRGETSRLDDFLPETTMTICSDIISQSIGSVAEVPSNPQFPWMDEYMLLRSKLREHIQNKTTPAIELLQHPQHGRERLAQLLETRGLDINVLENLMEGGDTEN